MAKKKEPTQPPPPAADVAGDPERLTRAARILARQKGITLAAAADVIRRGEAPAIAEADAGESAIESEGVFRPATPQ